MNTRFVILSLVSLYFASCSVDLMEAGQESLKQTGELKTETIQARFEIGASKVTIATDGGGFAWTEATDQIAVHTTGGYVISNGASASGENTSFTVSYDNSYYRDAFALYPCTLVYNTAAGNFYSNCESHYGQDESGLTIMLPSIYALSDIQDERTVCPMIADNNGLGWSFRQLCGLLRLTVNEVPEGTSYLVVDFNGQKVCGRFTMASPIVPGNSTIVTKYVDDATDQITITGVNSGVTINLPLPTGEYHTITIVAYNSSNVPLKAEHTLFQYTAQAAKGKKIVCPTLTKGIFSIANGEYAIVAPGNLKYVPSINQWSFHGTQYGQCETVANTNVSAKYTSEGTAEIDYFGWGTSGWDFTATDPTWQNYQPYATAKTTTEETNNVYKYGPSFARADRYLMGENANGDWGIYNAIGADIAGTWHALPSWGYLLNTRTVTNSLSEGARYTMATLGGTHLGLILFPDNYTHPDGTGFVPGKYNGTSNFTATVSLDGWAKMEAAGAAFLPAAGYRDGNTVKRVGTFASAVTGGYWSTRANNASGAYYLYFSNSAIYADNASPRYTGYSVRLVRDITRMNGQADASISDVDDVYQNAW